MAKFVIDKSNDFEGRHVYRLLSGEGSLPGNYFQENREGMKKELATSKSAEEIVATAKNLGASWRNCSWPGHKAGDLIINPVTALDRGFSK